MNKNTIIAIVLGVLVLVSIVQAFQLNGLKTKLSSGAVVSKGSVSTSSQNTASASGAPTSSVPKSLENLPQMVGGC